MMTMNKESFMESQRLVKRARSKMGTQGLATKLGVTRQTVWRYEAGDPMPKHMQLAIAALLAEHEQEKRA
jgi:DNA-binding XRE family transcriptional regulator